MKRLQLQGGREIFKKMFLRRTAPENDKIQIQQNNGLCSSHRRMMRWHNPSSQGSGYQHQAGAVREGTAGPEPQQRKWNSNDYLWGSKGMSGRGARLHRRPVHNDNPHKSKSRYKISRFRPHASTLGIQYVDQSRLQQQGVRRRQQPQEGQNRGHRGGLTPHRERRREQQQGCGDCNMSESKGK